MAMVAVQRTVPLTGGAFDEVRPELAKAPRPERFVYAATASPCALPRARRSARRVSAFATWTR